VAEAEEKTKYNERAKYMKIYLLYEKILSHIWYGRALRVCLAFNSASHGEGSSTWKLA